MTDNPHYVTPEEAEEKTCPYDAKNWGTCMSSQCMAWRWRLDMTYSDKGFNDGQKYSTTHGYCGMVQS
jgi:hypothetical protein